MNIESIDNSLVGVLNRLDELITLARTPPPPPERRWINADVAARMLAITKRQFVERIAPRPDFPTPFRLDGVGRPRWKESEVDEWATRHRGGYGR